MSTSTARRSLAARASGIAGWLVLGAAVAALATAALIGVRFLPVLTGSMAPYAPTGSLVLTLPVPGSDVAVGDVVAFRPPAPYTVTGNRPILHRVATLGSEGGQSYLTSKGDANPAADPWQVATDGATFGRAALVVPHLGRVFAGGTWAALALVLGAAALFAGARRLRMRTDRYRAGHEVPIARLSAILDVPAAEWQQAGGRQRAEAQLRAGLDATASARGLTLVGEPVQGVTPGSAGGLRLVLTGAAI